MKKYRCKLCGRTLKDWAKNALSVHFYKEHNVNYGSNPALQDMADRYIEEIDDSVDDKEKQK